MDNKELRKAVKKAISLMTDQQKTYESEEVCKLLENSQLFANSKNILCYWSMDDEIDTKTFMQKWFCQKNFLLPSIKGNELEVKRFIGIDNLQEGARFNILEPVGNAIIDYDIIDLIIVPGRVFDQEGHRIGRGLGFYDRILGNIQAKKIGVCFKCQLFDKIQTEEHDIKMDIVLHP